MVNSHTFRRLALLGRIKSMRLKIAVQHGAKQAAIVAFALLLALGGIIAGAGGAAHLPGMLASLSPLPVIGVPVKSRNSIDGWDSVLSILQMPGGVPVATVALDGAKNAGILAAQILGSTNPDLQTRISEYKEQLKEKVIKGSEEVRKQGNS